MFILRQEVLSLMLKEDAIPPSFGTTIVYKPGYKYIRIRAQISILTELSMAKITKRTKTLSTKEYFPRHSLIL